MTKKEYIIYLLEDLKDIWNFADSLLGIINKLDDNNELIDKLFIFLKANIEKVNDKKLNEAFLRSKEKLKENIKEEKAEKWEDESELNDLEKELEILL